jgi:hypothetical protein
MHCKIFIHFVSRSSMALRPLVRLWPIFKFRDKIQSRCGSLYEGSAGRKASTYT